MEHPRLKNYFGIFVSQRRKYLLTRLLLILAIKTLHCMLVLNAPGFFSMFWGIIKKFIDPRTAQRIQVFSNEQKGLAALEQLVEKKQIPEDYGGTNKSISQALLERTGGTGNNSIKRQERKLCHFKHKKKPNECGTYVLGAGEKMTITLYTRSASSAYFTVTINNKVAASNVLVSAKIEDGSVPLPKSTRIATNIAGPGTVEVTGHDNDDASKQHNGCSKGYFLLVGDVV